MSKTGTRSAAKPPPPPPPRSNTRTLLVLSAVVVAIAVGAIVWLTGDDSSNETAESAVTGVKSFDIGSPQHVEGTVAYEQSPPVGGNHAPVWLNCGTYGEQVPNELAVHALEHGAAWITYRPDVSTDQIGTLAALGDEAYTVVSPFSDLDSPIVVTSWGKQLAVESADDPSIAAFLDEYRESPDAPEPGAPCTGGQGTPQ